MSQGESTRALPSTLRSLPQQWELTRLRYLSSIRYGLGQPPREMPDGLPLIRATNVKRGRIVRENLVFVDPSDVPPGRDATLRDGDIVVVRSGAYTGDSALVTKEYDGAITGYDMVVRPTRVNSRFLAYTLLSTPVLNDQIDLCRLRAAQPHLNAKELGDTWVAVPPAEEQLAIADYLDEKTAAIDALIAKRERHIELLRERRNAVVTSYVLGLSEPTSGTHGSVEPPHLMRIVPNYWSVRRVKFVMERAVDCPHSTPEYDPDGEYPAVRTSDIEPGRLNLEGARRVSEAVYRERTNRLVPDGNDIIYSREGERFGMAALVPPRTKLCLAQRVMIFRPARVHCPRYVMWALNSSAFYEQVRQDTVGATSPRVNIPTILNAWVPVPPPAEQVEIAVRIESVVARFDALQELELRQMDKLREYRQTLISTAVMGQIPVRQEVPA